MLSAATASHRDLLMLGGQHRHRPGTCKRPATKRLKRRMKTTLRRRMTTTLASYLPSCANHHAGDTEDRTQVSALAVSGQADNPKKAPRCAGLFHCIPTSVYAGCGTGSASALRGPLVSKRLPSVLRNPCRPSPLPAIFRNA